MMLEEEEMDLFLGSCRSSCSQCPSSDVDNDVHGALNGVEDPTSAFSSTWTYSLSDWSLTSRARRRSITSFSFGRGDLD